MFVSLKILLIFVSLCTFWIFSWQRGRGEMFTYILDKSCKALSVLLGGVVVGGNIIAFVLVVVPVVFKQQTSYQPLTSCHAQCLLCIGGAALSLLIVDYSITRNGKRISCSWNMTKIIKEHFVRCVESKSLSHFKNWGYMVTKLFKKWKRVVEKMRKMRAHSKSDSHIKHCEEELLAARARKEGSSIIQQVQIIVEQKRIKNRSGIKTLLLCTHFLALQHIPHTTNFDKLVDLVVSCGGEDLKLFADRSGRNATYTSTDVVFDFIEAIVTWVDEFQLKLLHKAPFFSLINSR